jgi:hypothetical protein
MIPHILSFPRKIHPLSTLIHPSQPFSTISPVCVTGLKEVDDQWMVSEMEVQQHPVRHRTKVRIQEVRVERP